MKRLLQLRLSEEERVAIISALAFHHMDGHNDPLIERLRALTPKR